MNGEWLYNISQWVTYPVSAILIFAAAEFGCWLGYRSLDRGHEAVRSHITAIQSALLGLLALLIGFTFSIAVSRYDVRRGLVLEEANAIGTAALRVQFLPPDHQAKALGLLRDYTGTRLIYSPDADAKGGDTLAKSLLSDLWSEAVFAAGQDTKSVPVGLFVQSVNDVIDLNEKRRIATRNHVPEVAFLLLYAMAGVACGFTGYAAGLAGTRQHIPNAIMALSIAVVIMLITDMDRPARGLITVNQNPLIRLQESFAR